MALHGHMYIHTYSIVASDFGICNNYLGSLSKRGDIPEPHPVDLEDRSQRPYILKTFPHQGIFMQMMDSHSLRNSWKYILKMVEMLIFPY